MGQDLRRDDLKGIERRSSEPQKTYLQCYAQAIERASSPLDRSPLKIGESETSGNFVGSQVWEPLPSEILSKRRIHDSALPTRSAQAQRDRSRNLTSQSYQSLAENPALFRKKPVVA